MVWEHKKPPWHFDFTEASEQFEQNADGLGKQENSPGILISLKQVNNLSKRLMVWESKKPPWHFDFTKQMNKLNA